MAVSRYCWFAVYTDPLRYHPDLPPVIGGEEFQPGEMVILIQKFHPCGVRRVIEEMKKDDYFRFHFVVVPYKSNYDVPGFYWED